MFVRAALLALAMLAIPLPVSAWTEAGIERLRAVVDVDRAAAAHVALELDVRVRGGWLERLELAGLDEGLTLDSATPVRVVGEDGTTYTPEVEVLPEGTIRLAFRRREAPRRGALHVTLAYLTSLAHRSTRAIDEDTIRVRFALPGFRSSLDGVEVVLRLPGGDRVIAAPRDPSDEEEAARGPSRAVAVHVVGETAELTFEEAHLPRTVPFLVAADVPADALDASLRAPRSVKHDKPELPGAPHHDYAPYVLAAALALVALEKRRGYLRACAERHLASRPVVLVAEPLRALLLLSAASVAAPLLDSGHALGLAVLAVVPLLVLERAPLPVGSSSSTRPATVRELRRARRAAFRAVLFGSGAFDVAAVGPALLTFTLGAAGLVALRMVRPADGLLPWALAMLAPIALGGTTQHLPLSPAQALERLVSAARALRIDLRARPAVFALEMHDGAPRLRCSTDERTTFLIAASTGLELRDAHGALVCAGDDALVRAIARQSDGPSRSRTDSSRMRSSSGTSPEASSRSIAGSASAP